MYSNIRVLIVCFISLFSIAVAKDFNLDLEYSLDGSSFSKLGSLNVQQRHDGNYSGNVKFDSSLSQTLFKQIQSKIESSPHSLYYVRSGELLSSNAACYMLKANLGHRIAVTLDQENGVVESLTVFPDGLYDVEAIGEKCEMATDSSPRLSGRVDVTTVQELPAPETAAYLQRMEEEKRNRQHGAATDNRSFIAKYWMYIVPVVIFMVVSSFMSGEEGGGQ